MSHKIDETKKEDLNQVLDRVTAWIENCDNKASIILGCLGVIVGILFGTDYISKFLKILAYMTDEISFGKAIFLILFVIATLSFIAGAALLVMVLLAKTTTKDFDNKGIKKDSILFFSNISSNKKLTDYRRKLANCSDNDYCDDIASQIYVCSLICTKKFARYKAGLISTVISLLFIGILAIIGQIVTK